MLKTCFRYWTHFARKFSQNWKIKEESHINWMNNVLAEIKLELLPSG